MSSKKSWLQTLAQIKNVDGLPSDIARALDLVASYVEELKFEKKEIAITNEFPLPKEVTSDLFAVALFCDGACRGNPGPGAWGAMAQSSSGELLFESSGLEVRTTNNQMELQGAINGLKSLKERGHETVFVFTDSKYVVDGVSSWMAGWKKRGWVKADNKPPENLALWKELDQMVLSFSKISFHWVKGHAGHPQNERCDHLANMALDESGF